MEQASGAPSDLLGLEVLRYSTQVGPFDQFKKELRETLRRRLNTNRALLWDMLEPEARRPIFILSSPKSPQRDSPDDPGLYDERTFGDYLGIVGLLSAFGSFTGEYGNVELISAQLYPKDLLASRPASLFLIGSPKSNRATGVVLTMLHKLWEPQWHLPPQNDAPAKGNYPSSSNASRTEKPQSTNDKSIRACLEVERSSPRTTGSSSARRIPNSRIAS